MARTNGKSEMAARELDLDHELGEGSGGDVANDETQPGASADASSPDSRAAELQKLKAERDLA